MIPNWGTTLFLFSIIFWVLRWPHLTTASTELMPRLLSSSYLHPACGCRFSRLGWWWWLTMLRPSFFSSVSCYSNWCFRNLSWCAKTNSIIPAFGDIWVVLKTIHDNIRDGLYLGLPHYQKFTEFLISLQPHRCPSAKHAWLCMWKRAIQRDESSESVFCGTKLWW